MAWVRPGAGEVDADRDGLGPLRLDKRERLNGAGPYRPSSYW